MSSSHYEDALWLKNLRLLMSFDLISGFYFCLFLCIHTYNIAKCLEHMHVPYIFNIIF